MATTMETWSRPAPRIRNARRQYQSCDACRRNRRACDAAELGVCALPGKIYHSDSAPEACSSCTRSKKPCTFNWLLSRPKQDLPKNLRRSFDTWNTMRVRRSTEAHEDPVIRRSAPLDFSATTSELFGLPLNMNGHEYPMPEPHNGEFDFPLSQPQLVSSQCEQDQKPQWQEQPMDWQSVDSSLNPHTVPMGYVMRPDYVGPQNFDCFDKIHSNQYNTLDLNPFDVDNITTLGASCPSTSPNQYDFTNAESISSLSSNISVQVILSDMAGTCSTSNFPTTVESESPSNHQGNSRDDGSSSPFSALQESISHSTNKFLISGSLLRIYHGSLEHALACWVTESNCPYKKVRRHESGLSPHSTFHQGAASPARSSAYARVCRLDDAFAPYRSLPLTKSDGIKATKALNAAILAFASQWSHVREVKSSYIQGTGAEDCSPSPLTAADEFEVPFERLVQQSLWHEARRSLLACADMDSFKVIFAQMIFSMTQQPLDAETRAMISESTNWSEDLAIGLLKPQGLTTLAESIRTTSQSVSLGPSEEERRRSYGMSQFEALSTLDGPPTHLEEALRHLASWRQRITLANLVTTSRMSPAQIFKKPSATDMQSFNMLFWLGVMCDTTSSTLTQRPLVITENDCALEINRSKHVQTVNQTECAQMWPNDRIGYPSMGNAVSELWGTYLLSTQRQTRNQPRWPCAVEEATAILQEAIPVKVLLFRRVAQMQALICARSGPREVEDLISATLLVYQHWTMTYSRFMSDCIADHENVPPKIQSWYVILAGHWHLGSLLAANCISQIDDHSLSESLQRSLRRSSALVLELKKTSINAISDLARVSCSSSSQSFRGSDDFHFAFSQSALLTEPWTNVLMHALEKACSIFLDWLSCRYDETDPQHEWVYQKTNNSELCGRASCCIFALQLLGRKSDAASMTAATLERHFTFITGTKAAFPPVRL